LLSLLAAEETPESILQSYPYLELEDVQEALSYAAFLADTQRPQADEKGTWSEQDLADLTRASLHNTAQQIDE
jgi:hypothetical protein